MESAVLELTPDITSLTVNPTESQQVFNSDAVDGYLPVTVNGIPSTYVGSGVTQRDSTDLTASGATVTAPAGYYAEAASKSVAAGTVSPRASKGTVSNHAINIIPYADTTSGFIGTGTYSGSGVTVSASELESGTKSITENGTGISVSGYSTVDVAVQAGTIIDDGDGNINLSPTGEVAVITPLTVNQNGTYTAPSNTGYSPVTVNVENNPVEPKDVNFIDYDGTLLYSYTKTEFANLSDLPSNPTHTGLTSQGWNWTKAQITAQLTAMPNQPVWVGQMYVTTSGATEIDITLDNPGRRSPYLSIAVNGTVSVDWGDNSTASTITGSSLTSAVFTLHEYASVGNYTIKISVSSGSFTFYEPSGRPSVLTAYDGSSYVNRRYDRSYSGAINDIRIGSGVTSIGISAFYNCYALQNITIPSGVTSIEIGAFNGCYALQSITIPSNVTSIEAGMFSGCYALQSITIPSGVTNIKSAAFQYCYTLRSVTIPSSVTSIGNNAFYNCYAVTEYHFQRTTPPTLGTTPFSGIIAGTIIYVPSAAVNDYKTASNWSTYASYMQGE